MRSTDGRIGVVPAVYGTVLRCTMSVIFVTSFLLGQPIFSVVSSDTVPAKARAAAEDMSTLTYLRETSTMRSTWTWITEKPNQSTTSDPTQISSALVLGFAFQFRTLKPDAHPLVQFEWHPEGSEAKPEVEKNGGAAAGGRLVVSLRHGALRISTYSSRTYGGRIQTITLGSGLNCDEWQTVKVTVDHVFGRLHASVARSASTNQTTRTTDGVTRSRSPSEAHDDVIAERSRHDSNGDRQQLTAVITAAGAESVSDRSNYSHDSVGQDSSRHFIGCLRQVGILDRQGHAIQVKDVLRETSGSRDTLVGCLDRCSPKETFSYSPAVALLENVNLYRKTENIGCENAGRCINYYVSARCDCYGTGYEGRRCEKKDLSVVNLDGSSYMIYRPREPDNWSPATSTRTALQFKYSHIALALHNATLHVSAIFVDRDVYNELILTIGSQLDDNRWHKVLLTQRNKYIEITLDDRLETMTLEHSHSHLNLPPLVYYGGLNWSDGTRGLKSVENFIGGLREIFFNDLSILNLVDNVTSLLHGRKGGIILGDDPFVLKKLAAADDVDESQLAHITTVCGYLILSMLTCVAVICSVLFCIHGYLRRTRRRHPVALRDCLWPSTRANVEDVCTQLIAYETNTSVLVQSDRCNEHFCSSRVLRKDVLREDQHRTFVSLTSRTTRVGEANRSLFSFKPRYHLLAQRDETARELDRTSMSVRKETRDRWYFNPAAQNACASARRLGARSEDDRDSAAVAMLASELTEDDEDWEL